MDDLNPGKPARRTKADRLADVHKRGMTRMDDIWSVVRLEREQNLRDRRFANIRGAQWEGQYSFGEDEEGQTGMARMEVPKFLRAIRRNAGEFRSARKTVDFKPKGDAGDRDADNLDGLYRADENDSLGGGQAAYKNAAAEAREGGFGAWRYRTRYEDDFDEENELQRIGIEPITDADQCVFFDLDAKHQQKLDARFGFVLFSMSRDAFEEEYPDASPTTFTDKHGYQYDWTQPDTITLAEYYEVEDKSILRRTFRNIADSDDDDAETRTYDDAELTAEREGEDLTLEAELLATGWEQNRERRINRQRVRKYILSGSECLKDEGLIAGRYIPVVPLYFKRAVIEGIERTSGLVRPAIDATRIYNVVASRLTNDAAGPSDDTPIVNPEQMDPTIAADWASRKVKNPAFLYLKPVFDNEGNIIQQGVSDRLTPTQVQPNVAALIQVMGSDIAELMGANDRPETVPSNTSAEAIELVNDAGDLMDEDWKDNFEMALAAGGMIWLSAAQDIYVEPGRKMIAIDAEGKKSTITLAERKTGEESAYVLNDLTTGSYDVIVDVGPATKSKRDATVKGMAGIANVYAAAGNSTAANAALGIAVLNMEGEGIDGFQQWTRQSGLREGWVEPNEEEAAALQEAAQNQPPDPNMLIAQAQIIVAQAEAAKAETGKIEAQARLMSAQANVEASRAKTIAALASVEREDRKQILAEVMAATEIDRDEHEQMLATIDASTRAEQHDRSMTQTQEGN